MSDFDRVLERLLNDADFKASVASDPARALAAYDLSDEERELLLAPLTAGSGADRTVEIRTSKSGVFGLVGPVVAAMGVAGAQSFGTQSLGTQSFGSSSGGGSNPGEGELFGRAPIGGEATFGDAAQSDGEVDAESFGTAGSTETLGDAASEPPAPQPPPLVEAVGYRTVVDVDGDGRWDAHKAYERADGGVDIHVDVDRDGRVDFIGHDVDRDRLVDSADYDTNLDGVMDTRMHDDTGDGYMDRREAIVPPPPLAPPPDKASPEEGDVTFGNAPA